MKQVLIVIAVLLCAGMAHADGWSAFVDTTNDGGFKTWVTNHATGVSGTNAATLQTLDTAGVNARARTAPTYTATTSNVSPKIANGTSGINVGSDSLMITPEGGIAILAKYGNGGSTPKIYKGMICTADTFGRMTATTTFGTAICYSDSVSDGQYSWFVIMGKTLVAFDSTVNLKTNQNLWITVAGSARFTAVKCPGDDNVVETRTGYIWGAHYVGKNARRDSLAYCIIAPHTIFNYVP